LINRLETIEDRSGEWPVMAIGNDWSRSYYDGPFHVFAAPPDRPAISLVFVQSRDGNTGAENPADLGGGPTDQHLLYEGLSRVAADAVLAGSASIGRDAFFTVHHPELVALRRELGLPRHPTQMVISDAGHIDLSARLFSMPEVPVIILAGEQCERTIAPQLRDRPWITIVPIRDSLAAALAVVRVEHRIKRISAIGGRVTATSLVDAGLVQDIYLTTSAIEAGDPNTPWYVGPHAPDLETIVRKREVAEVSPILFEHLVLTQVDGDRREKSRLQEYENAVEGMEEMFTVIDRDYRYLVANRAFVTYRHLDKQRLIGRRVQDLLRPEAWHIVKSRIDECFTSGHVLTYEMQYNYPDIGVRDLSITYFPIGGPSGVSRIACVLRDITDRTRTETALRRLSGQLLRIEDEGRRRLARNLHDTTAQHLAALSLHLSVVNEQLGAGHTRGHRAIAESMVLADTCLREIRTVSYLLHPPELDTLGLRSALVRYVEGFSERSAIQVDLRASDRIGRLSQDIETAIFRIVQECLTNIHRHSGSPTANIDVDRVAGALLLEVRDVGRGMRPDTSPGVGVTSMRERVKELGGQMEIRSNGSGTTVSVTIPTEEPTP
jgi:PAS domain S-box-containing protein